MFDKYKPVYAPDVEAGAGETQDTGAVVNEQIQTETRTEKPSLRQQIERGFEESKAEQPSRRKPKSTRSTQAEEMRSATTEQRPEAEVAEEEPEITEVGSAPEGWAAEAKAVWAELPPAVQAAVIKRETDMSRGVAELKKKYDDIDRAIAPRLEAIRRHGHTPAAAVNQLFAWWEALAANPDQTFPALAQSLNYDLRRLLGQQQPQQPQQPQAPQQAQPQQAEQPQFDQTTIQRLIEESIKKASEPLEQKYNSLVSSWQQNNQAKTNEILANWSKDKAYFEEVRERMAHLIATGAVPPLPNGSADLDRAYDEAVWSIPTVRAKVLADQNRATLEARKAKLAAEQKAQQEQAEKAKRASGSLSPSSPGVPATQKPPAGKSVRESLQDAFAQYRD